MFSNKRIMTSTENLSDNIKLVLINADDSIHRVTAACFNAVSPAIPLYLWI